MQVTLQIPRRIDVFSDEELYAFCQANPDLRIERDENGQIIIMPPTGLESSRRNMSLGSSVWQWNHRKKAGVVTDSNGGYTLPDTSMRAPDVGFVSNERLATVPPDDLKKFARVCPDFVIELRSESDTLIDLQRKMEKWLQNGVRLAWLIDPETEQTHIYRPGKEPEMRSFAEALSGEGVLEGFELNVKEVFES
ncbi:Uma2 family endonuclease [Nibrella saemangeumensis]|uniref:Uma2 family endonuclease n=1 Tax=Nibrella saemangeumensis TaxID=1084526 RepID=A0ABP8MQM3_9BACT